MQVKLYLKNAALLTASGFALRILGMAFRVYIAGQLGSEGMGLYQLILSVYMVFVSLATAGINVASTRLAAQNLARGRGLAKTMRSLVCTAAMLGTGAMLLQAALAEPAARYLLHDTRAELSLRVLSISLPFMAAAGALRGCFLAVRRVQPNVTAQLVEQCVRMAVVFFAVGRFVHWGAGYACAAVLVGNTVSEAVSCLILFAYARREDAFRPGRQDMGAPYTRRELWGTALPVQGGRLLASALQAVESTLIPYSLALYLGERPQAVAQYGALKGMAIPLIFFPFSILAALSGLLMPEITRAHTRRDAAQLAALIDSVMTLTGLLSVLAGLAFVLFGSEAAGLLYHDEQVGRYVQVLGFVAPFMYLESMVDGVLKGLGEQWATFRYSLLDSAVRIAGIWLLLPRFGMAGFLAVMAASNLMTCALNTARMLRCTGIRSHWLRWAALPAALALLGTGAVLAVRRFGLTAALPGWAALLAQALALCAGYLLPALLLAKKIAAPIAGITGRKGPRTS